MRNFKLTPSYNYDEYIDIPELIESIFDDDNYCGDVVKRKGSYDSDKQTWLGFVNNQVTWLERNVSRDCPSIYIRLGDPQLIASLMTAILQQDNLPFIVQADFGDRPEFNNLLHISLNFFKKESNSSN